MALPAGGSPPLCMWGVDPSSANKQLGAGYKVPRNLHYWHELWQGVDPTVLPLTLTLGNHSTNPGSGFSPLGVLRSKLRGDAWHLQVNNLLIKARGRVSGEASEPSPELA